MSYLEAIAAEMRESEIIVILHRAIRSPWFWVMLGGAAIGHLIGAWIGG